MTEPQFWVFFVSLLLLTFGCLVYLTLKIKELQSELVVLRTNDARHDEVFRRVGERFTELQRQIQAISLGTVLRNVEQSPVNGVIFGAMPLPPQYTEAAQTNGVRRIVTGGE